MSINKFLAASLVCFSSFSGFANTITSNDANCFKGVDRIFSVTANSVANCLQAGPGNINGNNQQDANLITAGWVFVDASDNSGGAHDGWLTSVGSLVAGLSGDFLINAAAYTTYDRIAIGFKSGEGRFDPDYAIFELVDNTFSGRWSITGNQALSHAILYGFGDGGGGGQNDIPEPATLVLVGLGLLGAALSRRRQPQS